MNYSAGRLVPEAISGGSLPSRVAAFLMSVVIGDLKAKADQLIREYDEQAT